LDDLRDTIEENEKVLLFTRVWGTSSAPGTAAGTSGNCRSAKASESLLGLSGKECSEKVTELRLERLKVLRVSVAERDRPRLDDISRASTLEIDRELDATELTLRMLADLLALLLWERGARTGMTTAPAPSPARLNIGAGAWVSQSAGLEACDADVGDASAEDWESESRAQAGMVGMEEVIPCADLGRVGRVGKVWTPSNEEDPALLE
jgi:hypothetical protein